MTTSAEMKLHSTSTKIFFCNANENNKSYRTNSK